MNHRIIKTLERWWAIEWSRLRANGYALTHRKTRAYVEHRLVEVRNDAPTIEWLYIEEDVYYRKEITFIGVVRGTWRDNDFQIVRWYYGNPRFDTGQPEGGAT